MLGAIIGDIVGSIFEFDNIKTKDFPLFGEGCSFTDDTAMTVATAHAITRGGEREDFIDSFHFWGRRYPYSGYGSRFKEWLISNSREPYNSWGNGSAMRVSPVGFCVRADVDYETASKYVLELARKSADVTHNHPEGIKGAQATAESILFMRRQENGDLPERRRRLRTHIQDMFGYDLSRSLNEIRSDYMFDESCQGTVPQAITAFIESTDFEDAIRNAISLGGDSDTLAAITGGIAQAAYGIPDWIYEKAIKYLDSSLLRALYKWEDYLESIS